MWGDIQDIFAPLLVIVLVVVGLFSCVNHQNSTVDRKIQECLAKGGTPIVVGHQYTSEFKGCKLP